jgi:hypothetical protein
VRILLSFSFAVVVSSGLAVAQSPGLQNQQVTSGVVGIVPGQTARFNLLYPTAPAPILQPLCSVTINIAADQGKILKTSTVAQFTAGRSVSLDLNGDTDLGGTSRTQIHAFSIAAAGCNYVATLELIDNITQKTVLVVGARQTWPGNVGVAPAPVGPPTPAFSEPPIPHRP